MAPTQVMCERAPASGRHQGTQEAKGGISTGGVRAHRVGVVLSGGFCSPAKWERPPLLWTYIYVKQFIRSAVNVGLAYFLFSHKRPGVAPTQVQCERARVSVVLSGGFCSHAEWEPRPALLWTYIHVKQFIRNRC